jgi:transcription antitermination factor NusG
MQKHWHIIYTKPKYEKKVAALLSKRKIETFCPINCKHVNSLMRNKLLYEPLFDSYVFAKLNENDIDQLKNVEGVVSLVYWKGQPAKINEQEIEVLQKFVKDHKDIKLIRTKVNMTDTVRIIDGPSYSLDGQVLIVRNKTIKVNLPSLGYTVVAEMEGGPVIGREVIFSNKELLLQ